MEENFEVYVRTKGETRWILESRYGASEKSIALEDAKDLERQSHIDAVRVVQETHVAATNATRERVIYTTAGKGAGAAAARPSGPSGPPARGRAAEPDDDDEVVGGPSRTPFDDDDDDDEEEAEGRGLFGRKKKPAPVDKELIKARAATGFRAYLVLFKLVLIVFVSFGLATLTTFLYVRYMA